MSSSKASSPIVEVVEQPVRSAARFMKIRTIVFACIFAFSFLWTVLLCVVIFAQWAVMDLVERYLIIIILFVQFITLVVVPFLLAGDFQPWMDGARCFGLFACHFGVAVWFIAKTPSFRCSSGSPSQRNICNVTIISILTANWVIPSLVLGYACGLGYFIHRLPQMPPPSLVPDIEKPALEGSIQHISVPPSTYRVSRMQMTPASPSTAIDFDRQRRASNPYSVRSNVARMSRAPPLIPIHDPEIQRKHPYHRSMQSNAYRASTVPYPTTPQTLRHYSMQSGHRHASVVPAPNRYVNPPYMPPNAYNSLPMQSITPSRISPQYGLPPTAYPHQPPAGPSPASLQNPQTQQQKVEHHNSVQSIYSQASYGYAT